MIDYEKRKRVMGRSLKLGHCICNPREPCPCDLFKRKNVCLCAGEREEEAAEEVPLTRLVENAGCASKISQDDLKKALSGLPRIFNPKVLVSSETCDDAGVFKLDDESALVQSVDVFTPIVDDPYLFGQIAAANSVSDIYAMGGKPFAALSIIGFPVDRVSHRVMNKLMQGGIDKLREAGTAVLGGHSIKNREILFGFAVTGLVHPGRIITNDKAKPGDVLILTKPLGTGTITFAAQVGKAKPAWLREIGRSMSALNRRASEIMVKAGVQAATDVTGFGLLGHLSEVAVQSGVTAEVYAADVPFFGGVLASLRREVVSGAIERNREYASRFVDRDEDVGEEFETALYDPQTSGGLLMCVGAKSAAAVLKKLRRAGMDRAAIIGRIVDRSEGKIVLRRRPQRARRVT
jgi:selenide,water dikinase